VASDGDPYEDYPEDDTRDTQNPAVALEAARMLRELGTARWKEGTAADALAKWQKALRYLDVHPVLPDDASPELADEFNTLRTPLLLNSALAAFKEPGGTAGARIAFSATSTVLGLPKLSDSDRGMYCFFLKVHVLKMLTVTCVSHFAAKALYRQGLAQVTLKEDEAAEEAFLEALSLAKEDKAIAAELERLRQRKKSQREKEKAAYKKFFG
jgi:peptidyl-prolyl isomerase D